MFRIWLSINMTSSLAAVGAEAQRAETLGGDVVMLADVAFDAFLGAQAAIQTTRHVEVAISGLVAFARSPMVTAVASWNLAALSGGRFRLGLSALVPSMLVGKYSVPWEPPAPRMREYIGALRAIHASWQTDVPLHYDGKCYRLNRQNSWTRPAPIEHPDIPIHLGAIGPRMSFVAGECARGLLTHPTNAARRYVSEVVLPRVTEGAEKGGRSIEQFELVVTPLCATGRTVAEVAAHREKNRELLGTLLSTPQYWPTLELHGWRSTGERLRELWREGRADLMPAQLTEEMLDTLMVTAPYDRLARALRERFEGLAHGICLRLSADVTHDAAFARVIRELQE